MVKNISATELLSYIYNEEYEMIDLRNFERYQKSHILGAICVEGERILAGDLDMLTKMKLVLYCERGGMSMRVASVLDKRGYEVYNLLGGYRQFVKIFHNFIKEN